MDLARLTRCVATASDSNGSKLATLPIEALEPWARFCQQAFIGPTTPQSTAATLRTVVAAAPGFANGWSNLAENLYIGALSPGADKAGLVKEAEKAADRALALDGKSAKALAVKSWVALGLAGPLDGSSNFGRLQNFAQWEALAVKSTRVRPSDCGCEVPEYVGALAMMGRLTAGLPLMDQAVTSDPTELSHTLQLEELASATGAYDRAEKLLSDLAERWADSKTIPVRRFTLALFRKDWAHAKELVGALPAAAEQAAYRPLLDALQKGDRAAAAAAANAFVPLTTNPQSFTPTALFGLALGGDVQKTADALETYLSKDSMFDMALAYTPVMADLRRSPRFAALTERMGLMDYWKTPGHPPDFCNEPDAPALCAAVSKS